MMDVLRTPVADAEMDEALEYLARYSPSAADKLSDLIDDAERVIGANPGMGKDRGDMRPGYRSVTVGKYQLFFRATAAEVIVLRFLHGSRDLPAALAEVDD
jgi:toxin ParE1/3/4